MTVIVFRDSILAADTAVWAGNIIAGHVPDKIVRLPDGRLVGGAGRVTDIQAFKKWIETGEGPGQKFEDFTGIVVTPEGEVTTFNKKLQATPEPFPWVALGMEDFCRGALAAGCSAEETVRLAIEYTDMAGGEVITLVLEPVQSVEEAPPDFGIAAQRVAADDWRERRGLR